MEKNKLKFYWAGLLVAVVMAFGIVVFAGCSSRAASKKTAQTSYSLQKTASVCFMMEAFI